MLALLLLVALTIVLAIVMTRFLVYNTGSLFPYEVAVYNYNDSGKSVDLKLNGEYLSKLNFGASTTLKVRNGDVLTSSHDDTDNVLQYTFYSSFLSVLNGVYVFGDSIQPSRNVVNLKITNSTSNDYYLFIVRTNTQGFPLYTPAVKSTQTISVYTYVGREIGFSTSSSYDDVAYNYITTLSNDAILITDSGISTQ